jgi:Fe-S-cluster containining protein
MGKKLSLLRHCEPCGARCCIEKGGGPRFSLKEKALIEARFGKERLAQGKGYWMPKKPEGLCTFLEAGLCALEDIKPVDCRIFPLDPIFKEDGQMDFVIDVNCPAAQHLPAMFISEAIRLGIGWMTNTEKEAFHHHWSRHKASNADQHLVKLSDFLSSRPEGFVDEIEKGLPPVHLISRILKG